MIIDIMISVRLTVKVLTALKFAHLTITLHSQYQDANISSILIIVTRYWPTLTSPGFKQLFKINIQTNLCFTTTMECQSSKIMWRKGVRIR